LSVTPLLDNAVPDLVECFLRRITAAWQADECGSTVAPRGRAQAGCGGESVYATCSTMGFTCAIDGDGARRSPTRARRGTARIASRAEAMVGPSSDSRNGPQECLQGPSRTRLSIRGNRSSRSTACRAVCPTPDGWNSRFRHLPRSGYRWTHRFSCTYPRKRSGVHYCHGEQHGRRPTEIRHATQLVHAPSGALTRTGPVAPDGVTSPSELCR
jgi:hypothetical protein